MRILVVEDDKDVGGFVVRGLKEAGHVVEHADNGRDGLFMAASEAFDAVILDRMLPGGIDGLRLLETLRAQKNTVPVLILSALADVDERVRGLKAGGDDYLTKPFAFAELLARVEALARRGKGEGPVTKLVVEDLELDLLSRQVKRAGQKIDLQPREFRLLEYLMRHAGQVVTRTMLLEGVWDYHFDPQTNVIDVHVSRLRQKVDKPFPTPLIHTVRNAGLHAARRKRLTMADELSPPPLAGGGWREGDLARPSEAPSASPLPQGEGEGRYASRRARRLLRSAGFRFAAVYALLLAVSAAALALFLWWATAGLLDRQTEAAIQADAQSLSERFAAGGLPALVLTIEDRLTQNVEDDAIYLLVDPAGQRIAGNLSTGRRVRRRRAASGTSCRSSAPACARWRWCRASTCRAAIRLLIGRDVQVRAQLRTLLTDALLWAVWWWWRWPRPARWWCAACSAARSPMSRPRPRRSPAATSASA